MGSPTTDGASARSPWSSAPREGEPLARTRRTQPSSASGSADGRRRWQVPERWAFVDAVPRTSVGKFDKKVIRKWYAEGQIDVE